MKTSNQSRRPAGFTLMELLVVISIIVILAGITLGGLNYVSGKQAREQAKVQIQLLQSALEDYASDNGGAYPFGPKGSPANRTRPDGTKATQYIFDALYPSRTTEKTYLTALDPNHDVQGWLLGQTGTSRLTIYDPWGTEYYYRVGDRAANPDFDLWSAGPDQKTKAGSNGDYDPKHKDNLDDIRGW